MGSSVTQLRAFSRERFRTGLSLKTKTIVEVSQYLQSMKNSMLPTRSSQILFVSLDIPIVADLSCVHVRFRSVASLDQTFVSQQPSAIHFAML